MMEPYATLDPLDDLIRRTDNISAVRAHHDPLAPALKALGFEEVTGGALSGPRQEIKMSDAIRKLNGTLESWPTVSERANVSSNPILNGYVEMAKKIPGLSAQRLSHSTESEGSILSYNVHYEYMPKAMVIATLIGHEIGGGWVDKEGSAFKKTTEIIAEHLSLAVEHKPKHFTIHTKCLEDGGFEARIETIERWCAAVVTAKTMVEVVEQAQKIGVVL